MTDENNKIENRADYTEALFLQLVVSFQTAAWQQMGKIASFVTGKIDRDLDMAKNSIDMLGMLEEKTRGNLSEAEKKHIDHILYELRMNYLEELKRGPDARTAKPASEEPTSEDDIKSA